MKFSRLFLLFLIVVGLGLAWLHLPKGCEGSRSGSADRSECHLKAKASSLR